MQVVLAVAHRDLRLALELFLAEEPGVFLVGVATDAGGASALLGSVEPDLLIMSWDLPGCARGRLAKDTLASPRAPQVIVLSGDEMECAEALSAGALAAVTGWDPPSRLSAAVSAAATRVAAANHRPLDSGCQRVE